MKTLLKWLFLLNAILALIGVVASVVLGKPLFNDLGRLFPWLVLTIYSWSPESFVEVFGDGKTDK